MNTPQKNMSNIFRFLNPTPNTPEPTTTVPPGGATTAAPPAPSTTSDPGTHPQTSTSFHSPWDLPPPSSSSFSSSSTATNPVLALYSRRLISQTEALYSLLQTSLAEIKEKQEGLAKLLGAGEKSVKVLEGKVGEVVGKVGVEGKSSFLLPLSSASNIISFLLG